MEISSLKDLFSSSFLKRVSFFFPVLFAFLWFSCSLLNSIKELKTYGLFKINLVGRLLILDESWPILFALFLGLVPLSLALSFPGLDLLSSCLLERASLVQVKISSLSPLNKTILRRETNFFATSCRL